MRADTVSLRNGIFTNVLAIFIFIKKSKCINVSTVSTILNAKQT